MNWLGGTGTREHRDWGTCLGNIGTGEHLIFRDWGAWGLGNKGTAEHRDWGISLGNIGTRNSSGEDRDWRIKWLENIGTGKQGNWETQRLGNIGRTSWGKKGTGEYRNWEI